MYICETWPVQFLIECGKWMGDPIPKLPLSQNSWFCNYTKSSRQKTIEVSDAFGIFFSTDAQCFIWSKLNCKFPTKICIWKKVMLWCSQQLKWTVHDECGTPWESALKKQLSKSNSSLDLLFWTPTMLHISLFFLTALNVNNWRFYPYKRALKFEILLESARIIFHCCSHFFFYCFFFHLWKISRTFKWESASILIQSEWMW